MERLDRISVRIEGLVRILAIAVLAFMLGTVLLDVLARNTALRVRGLDELARYSLVWLVFLVTGAGARYGDLIGMDALANALPGRLGTAAWLLRRVLFLVFLALFAWYALGIVQLMIRTGRASANLHIPLWFVYAPLFVGTVLMLLSLAVDLALRIARLRRGAPLAAPADDRAGGMLWN